MYTENSCATHSESCGGFNRKMGCVSAQINFREEQWEREVFLNHFASKDTLPQVSTKQLNVCRCSNFGLIDLDRRV